MDSSSDSDDSRESQSSFSTLLYSCDRLSISESSEQKVVSKDISKTDEASSSSSDSETDENYVSHSYGVVVSAYTVEKMYEESPCKYTIRENLTLGTMIRFADQESTILEKYKVFIASEQNRIVGITEIKEQFSCHVATVVGSYLYEPQMVKCTEDHVCHSLVMANCARVPPHYFPVFTNGRTSLKREVKYNMFDSDDDDEEGNRYVVLSIKHLSTEDSEAVRSHGKNSDKLTFEQACLYIRDPYVAVSEMLRLSDLKTKMESRRSPTAVAIEKGFIRFFNDKHFDAWCGRTSNTSSLLNMDEYEDINGNKLDVSQMGALKKAVCHPGFTVISSPPGSGKTTVIASICHAKWDINSEKERKILITSSMNCATTEAVLKVKDSTELRVCRKFSVNKELELDERESKVSAKVMSKSSKYNHCYDEEGNRVLLRIAQVEDRLEEGEYCKKEYGRLQYELRQLNKQLERVFIRDYQPQVFGTTLHYILHKLVPCDYSHLIFDECSRISAMDALAVYCACPFLEYITILGDSNQLPPYCIVEFDGLANELANLSEIKRMESLSTVNNCKLGFIYRSHPKLTDMLLRPIYGPNLQSGITESARSLARRNRLPVAKDGTPCLFVQIGKQKKEVKDREYWKRKKLLGPQKSARERRINDSELDAVENLLNVLKERNVDMKDVLIVVHHLDQMSALNQRIRNVKCRFKLMGNTFYCDSDDSNDDVVDDTEAKVMTADSCQGVEAAVVIVMTTKTCDDIEKAVTSLSFICEPHRETVAVSRAREAVYIFGDWEHLLQLPFWNKYSEIVKERGALVDDKLKHIE